VTRRIVWSADALDDLDGAVAYIAERNPAAARRVVAAIIRVVERLGRQSTGRRGRVPGTYEAVVPRLPYIVAYALTPRGQGEAVFVLRVIHGARDWRTGRWPR
jgi:plasmid stabilization system protein ParE